VEHLLRDIKDSTTTTLATRVTQQADSLRALQSRIVDLRDYLLQVAKGKLPVNHQITYHLQDALNLLPDLSNPLTTGSFIMNTNDQLLVVYLTSLVRAVIALHALVDNKAQNSRTEAEEAKKSENTAGNGKDKEKAKEGATKTEEKSKST
jgi:26S proteasome regulatory subunit N8